MEAPHTHAALKVKAGTPKWHRPGVRLPYHATEDHPMSRFHQTAIAAALGIAISGFACAGPKAKGPMAFVPIPGSAYAPELTTDPTILTNEPWKIPEGYRQYIVSDESDLDLYVGSDWNDMNTVNETRKRAGRYLYRTHEVRPNSPQDPANSLRRDGGSGGALAISVGDRILMLENAMYAVASPEACASILWNDSKQAPAAAEALRVTAADLHAFGIIDEVIPEPLPAHEAPGAAIRAAGDAIDRQLREIEADIARPGYGTAGLLAARHQKYRRMGRWNEAQKQQIVSGQPAAGVHR